MKKTFVNFDEEFEAMENWFNESDYGKVVKQIEEICKDDFPMWKSDWGFETNDLEHFVASQECGFNGREESFANNLMLFLGNYDIICVVGRKISVKQSNNQEVAELVLKLKNLALNVSL